MPDASTNKERGTRGTVTTDEPERARMRPSPIEPAQGQEIEEMRSAMTSRYGGRASLELAIAVSRGTGLRIVGIWEGTAFGAGRPEGKPMHAAVRCGYGFVDARGYQDGKTFERRHGLQSLRYDMRDTTERELAGLTEIVEADVEAASRAAQALWPDLAWSEKTDTGRMAAFVEELAALSRRHGIWIRAPYATTKPILTMGHGDEDGYLAEASPNGGEATIDRRLHGMPGRRSAIETRTEEATEQVGDPAMDGGTR